MATHSLSRAFFNRVADLFTRSDDFVCNIADNVTADNSTYSTNDRILAQKLQRIFQNWAQVNQRQTINNDVWRFLVGRHLVDMKRQSNRIKEADC